MKKIGIITLTGDNNYGNKLQNYAMEKILSEHGDSVETIRIDYHKYSVSVFKNMVQYIIRGILPKARRKRVERKRKFLDFNAHLNFTRNTVLIGKTKPERIKRILRKYDCIIYGSDQIWNTEFPSFSPIYMGYYAPMEKNIATSASFGKETLTDAEKERFRKGLQNFRSISTREEKGSELVYLLTDKTCPVTPDPTLCLTKEEWIQLEKPYPFASELKFYYFLGEMPTSLTVDSSVIIGNKTSNFGPSEFISIIHHAREIHTDSFHASVFSIIFNVDVYIYDRKSNYSSMFSRIVTLLEQLNVNYEKKEDTFFVSAKNSSCDRVREALSEQKAKMDDYLSQFVM